MNDSTATLIFDANLAQLHNFDNSKSSRIYDTSETFIPALSCFQMSNLVKMSSKPCYIQDFLRRE